MDFMRPYPSIPGYLIRKTIISLGRFFVREHKIDSADGTPYLHNHPFAYVTIVLKGGYVEQYLDLPSGTVRERRVRRFVPTFRRSGTYHRIKSVEPETRTAFFGFNTGRPWGTVLHSQIKAPDAWTVHEDGVYLFTDGYRKCRSGRWYTLSPTPTGANSTTVLSIHQTIQPIKRVEHV